MIGVSRQHSKSCGEEGFSAVSEKHSARVTLGLSRSLWRMLGFIFHILYDPCVCPLDTFEPFHLVRNEPQWLPDEAAGCEAHKQLAKNYSWVASFAVLQTRLHSNIGVFCIILLTSCTNTLCGLSVDFGMVSRRHRLFRYRLQIWMHLVTELLGCMEVINHFLKINYLEHKLV